MIEEMAKDRNNVESRVKEAYEKAQALQDKLNAVITFVDPEEQLKELPEDGAFYGVPIVLKDNVNTKGIRTTAGSKILSNYVPVYDAEIVTKLKKACAVCIAKASMDELAMGGTNLTCFTGPAYNPWDTRRMTGGSSGGSAALVASGVVPMAIGSDTGDSVRKPASFCGIVGVKPTYGRISRYGIIQYASSLDHVGYFTRSIEDAAATFNEVPDYSALLNDDIKGKKIAVIGNVIKNISNQETVKMFNDLMDQLRAKGAIVDVYDFDNDMMRAILPAYFIIANCEATSNDSNLDGIRFGVREDGEDMEAIMTNSRTKGFGPLIRRRFVIGSYSLFKENQEELFLKAQKARRAIVNRTNELLEIYDAIYLPCVSGAKKKLEGASQDKLSASNMIVENHLAIGNFSGLPSISLPIGLEDNFPFDANLTGRAFDEANLLNIAYSIEQRTNLKDLVVEKVVD